MEEKTALKKTQFTTRVEKVIDTLHLPQGTNKELLKLRFLDEVEFYERKRDKTRTYYNVFRFIVTTGSILLPALLSIGQMDPNKLPRNFDQISYWSTWSISLLVTISNGFLQLFSLDKNYFNYSLTVEQLKTEGWQFFGLSGKYEEHEEHNKKSYKDFCKAIETIKRKQVEQEFSGKADSKKKKKEFNFAEEMMKFQNEAKKSSEGKPTEGKSLEGKPSEERPLTGKTPIPPKMPSNMPPIMPHRDLESGFINLAGDLTNTLNESRETIENKTAKELDDLQKKLENAEKLLKDKEKEKPNITAVVNDSSV